MQTRVFVGVTGLMLLNIAVPVHVINWACQFYVIASKH